MALGQSQSRLEFGIARYGRSALIACAVAAGCMGLVVQRLLGLALDEPLAETHAVGLLFGGAGAVLLSRCPLEQLYKWAWPAYFLGLLLLLLAFTPLRQGAGFGNQLDLRLFDFDPRPFAVLLMIPALARAISPPQKGYSAEVSALACIVPIFLLLLLLASTLSAFMVAAITAALLFVGGTRMAHFLRGVVATMFLLGYLVQSEEYRRARITTFLDPYADPSGNGYVQVQIYNLLRRAGDGSLVGDALASSLRLIPGIADTQVAAANVAVGGKLLLVGVNLPLLGLVLFTAYLAIHIDDRFRQLVCCGVAFLLILELLGHLAQVSGMLPGSRMLMPFVSCDPSALAAQSAAVGLLLAVLRGDQGLGHRASRPPT